MSQGGASRELCAALAALAAPALFPVEPRDAAGEPSDAAAEALRAWRANAREKRLAAAAQAEAASEQVQAAGWDVEGAPVTLAEALASPRRARWTRPLVALLRFAPFQDGGTLLVLDASLQGETRGPGLYEDALGCSGVPVVLGERARLSLDRVAADQVVVLTEWRVVGTYVVTPGDGFSGPMQRPAGPVADDLEETIWPAWPRALEGRRQLGVYIEVLALRAVARAPVRKRKRGEDADGAPIECVVLAVGPLMQGRQPRFYMDVQLLPSGDGEPLEALMVVSGFGAVDSHALVRPRDVLAIEGAECKMNTRVPGSRLRRDFVLVGPEAQLTRSARCPPDRDEAREVPGEVDYVGQITGRVGAFVLELDNDKSCKLFLTHVPAPAAGIGLRPGARVCLDHVRCLYVRGLLRGFVLTMRSSIRILRLAPEPLADDQPFIRMAVAFQRLLGKVSAECSFWKLDGLARLAAKHPHAVRAPKKPALAALGLLERLAGQSEAALAARSVVTEFLERSDALCPRAVLADGSTTRCALPFMPTMAELLARIEALLGTGSLEQFVRRPKLAACLARARDPQVAAAQAGGAEGTVLRIPSSDLFAHSASVALVGWLTCVPATGQLMLEDRSGGVEVALRPHDLRRAQAAVPDSQPRALVLTDFAVVVESLGWKNTSRPPKLSLQPGSNDDVSIRLQPGHVCGQYGTNGNVVFRVYVEVVESAAALEADSWLCQPTAAGAEQERPSLSALVLEAWHPSPPISRAGTFTVKREIVLWTEENARVTVKIPARGGRTAACLRAGEAFRVRGLAPGARGPVAADSAWSFNAVTEEERARLLWGWRAAQGPEADGELPGATLPVGAVLCKPGSFAKKPASVHAVVVAISLRDKFQGTNLPGVPMVLGKSSASIELRDHETGLTALCYLDPLDRVLPAGALRLGSTIALRRVKVVSSWFRGTYFQAGASTAIEVADVLASPALADLHAWPRCVPKPPGVPAKTLQDVLVDALTAPGAVHFYLLSITVVEVQYLLIAQRCRACGCALDARHGATCPPGWDVTCKLDCTVEDGTGQASLVSMGPQCAEILSALGPRRSGGSGSGVWAELCSLLGESKTGHLEYKARGLQPLPEPADGAELAAALPASLQARFEDAILVLQCSLFRRHEVVAKVHSNTRKSSGANKPSMFRGGKEYTHDIPLARGVTVCSGNLPKLNLVALAVRPAVCGHGHR